MWCQPGKGESVPSVALSHLSFCCVVSELVSCGLGWLYIDHSGELRLPELKFSLHSSVDKVYRHNLITYYTRITQFNVLGQFHKLLKCSKTYMTKHTSRQRERTCLWRPSFTQLPNAGQSRLPPGEVETAFSSHSSDGPFLWIQRYLNINQIEFYLSRKLIF